MQILLLNSLLLLLNFRRLVTWQKILKSLSVFWDTHFFRLHRLRETQTKKKKQSNNRIRSY